MPIEIDTGSKREERPDPRYEPGPLQRHLIHQPRQNWSPGTIYRCTHRVKDQDATVLVGGFKRGDYRQCTVCGAEVAA